MITSILTEAQCKSIDNFLAKYPDNQRQSAVISALMLVQSNNGGWLTQELMDAVADYIEMPKIAVYEVASFYSLYDLRPVGKNKIYVCTNVSCMLRGSDKIVEHLKSKLEIDIGQTTVDKKFTLKSAECLGACGGAPMMQIGDNYYENLSTESVDKILSEIQ